VVAAKPRRAAGFGFKQDSRFVGELVSAVTANAGEGAVARITPKEKAGPSPGLQFFDALPARPLAFPLTSL